VSVELPTASRNVLCLGEALVDLVCERPVAALEEADTFAPHSGGAAANVALMAARSGARTALAGGVGDDDWGRWLRGRLERAGVDLDHFKLIEDMPTPLALTTVDPAGEPTFRFYGEAIAPVVNALADGVEAAVDASGGLFINANALTGEARNVVITDGAGGAILRGKIKLDVAGVPARVVSTIGAGDALMAALIARLQITGFYEPAIAAALKEAMVVAARACERWGACD
jgi:sugar/nucleoside kinase (ribokinase family)